MMWLLRALLTAMALSGMPVLNAIAAPAVASMEGTIGSKNFKKFSDAIGQQMDKIVHLKIWVDIDLSKEKKFHADLEGNRLTMYLPYNAETIGNAEILINDGIRYQHGFYVVDGYYVVKSGGMHQGMLSWGLMPVDEAQVLLSGAKRKKPRMFK